MLCGERHEAEATPCDDIDLGVDAGCKWDAATAVARAARKEAMKGVTPVSLPAAVGKMLLLPQDPAGPLQAALRLVWRA